MRYFIAVFTLPLLSSCESFFETTAEMAKDPAVQQKFAELTENVATGNWVAAIGGLIGLATTGVIAYKKAYKKVMMVRDANRLANKEPVGKPN